MRNCCYNGVNVRISGNGEPTVHMCNENEVIIDATKLKKRDPNVPCMYTISNGVVILELCYNRKGQLHCDNGPAKLIRYTHPDGMYNYEWCAQYYQHGKLVNSELGDDTITYSEYMLQKNNPCSENRASNSPPSSQRPKLKCVNRVQEYPLNL